MGAAFTRKPSVKGVLLFNIARDFLKGIFNHARVAWSAHDEGQKPGAHASQGLPKRPDPA